MDEHLKSAIQKMGMSKTEKALNNSIDLLLKEVPEQLEEMTNYFSLTQEEIESFKKRVKQRKEKLC